VGATRLALDESMLSGESLPVEKQDGDAASAGTLVSTGAAWLVVTRTGRASALGRLAMLLGTIREEPTLLERRLRTFGRHTARAVLTMAVVFVLVGLWIEGAGRAPEVLLFAVALAVAAVPEGLPAVLTVTLALGVERMARRNAVVRRLTAVEALGSVTVIATDKTGTLTENRLEVRGLDAPDPVRARRAMVLAGETAGDPLDAALVAFATQHGVEPGAARAAFRCTAERPFDAAWRYACASGQEGGAPVTYYKGAPEVLLAQSALTDAQRAHWRARLERHAGEGVRLLGLACDETEGEGALTWLGLVMLWDPPRPEVPAAIARARAAGIRVVMVTGDHPTTAATIARTVGIASGRVVTGAELETLDPAALREAVAAATVYARVKPEQKVAIVEALAARGEIVAMTGDGVNDGPALKRAAVGVAMGLRGSDVSREVADLVLLDDDFATIVAAIEEGRGIYENVQTFVRFLFATNFAEVLVVAGGLVAAVLVPLRDAAGGLLLPLTAAQLLWINLVTDGLPAVMLGLDRVPGVMTRPPRDPAAPLLDGGSLRFIVLAGTGIAVATLALFALAARGIGLAPHEAPTAAFMVLAAAQLTVPFAARRPDLRVRANRMLRAAVVASLGLQIVILLTPALRAAFDVAALAPPATSALVVGWLVSLAAVYAARALAWRAEAEAPRRARTADA
jgi:Ca2+-transporting ATPase